MGELDTWCGVRMSADELRAIGELEYDPVLHLTAGELRAIGKVILPEHIPDCAYIPRAAFFDPDTVEVTGDRNSGLKVSWESRTDVPFRWVEVRVTLKDS